MMKIPLKAISLNNMYSTGRGGKRFLTKKGKEFKEAFASYLFGQQFYFEEAEDGKVVVELVFAFKDKRKRDVDNLIKATLDACTGLVWDDDSQVQAVYAEKKIDTEEYILIEVGEPTPCKVCGHLAVIS